MSTQKRSLAIDVAGLALPTPVLVAAGCAGTGRELQRLVDVRRLGGVVSRTITVEARTGSAPPRIAETPAGLVWSTGLQNPGIDAFCETELPLWAHSGVPLVVSIGGATLEQYVRLVGALNGRAGVAAIELYLSGPDEERERPVLGAHADRVTEIVGAVARMSLVPVIAKVPGGVDVAPLAIAAARAGAAALTLTASPPALAVDPRTGEPVLGARAGWLSGPALKPHNPSRRSPTSRGPSRGCRCSRAAESAAPGMRSRRSLAGAIAVQVGTATLDRPGVPGRDRPRSGG